LEEKQHSFTFPTIRSFGLLKRGQECCASPKILFWVWLFRIWQKELFLHDVQDKFEEETLPDHWQTSRPIPREVRQSYDGDPLRPKRKRVASGIPSAAEVRFKVILRSEPLCWVHVKIFKLQAFEAVWWTAKIQIVFDGDEWAWRDYFPNNQPIYRRDSA